jgi:uncharacterized repeat protein (TIGR01451 family)
MHPLNTRPSSSRHRILATMQALALASVGLTIAVSTATTTAAVPTGVVYPTSWTGTGDTRVGSAGGVTVTASAGGAPSSIYRVGDMQIAVLGLDLPAYMPTDANAAIAWGATGCSGGGDTVCGTATCTFDKPVTNLTMWISDVGAVEGVPVVTTSHATPLRIAGGGTFEVDGTSANATIVPASGSGSSISHQNVLGNVGQIFVDNGPNKNNSRCGIFFGCGVYTINTSQTVYNSITFNFGYTGTGTSTDAFPMILGYTPATAGISLAKSSTTAAYGVVGDTIDYSFSVTNTGNVPLSPVTITDASLDAAATCPASLAAGATDTCTGTHTVIQADLTAGSFTNTATATGTPPGGMTPVTSTSSSATVPVAQPSISLTKTGTASGNMAGDTITYGFHVTNTGNVALSPVTVTDPTVGPVTCPAGPLAVAASVTCTPVTAPLTQADVDAGKVDNTATAHGTPPSGPEVTDPDSISVPISAHPAITLDKQHSAPGSNTVGTAVPYTFTVKNTGNVTLHSISVADAKIGTVTCPANTLMPGTSTTCTGNYVILHADVSAGKIDNTATAEGTPPLGAKVTATDTDTLALPLASITLDKRFSGGSSTSVGAKLAYSFVVANTGNLTLTDIVVSDAMLTGMACPQDTLEPDGSMTCTADPYVVTSADEAAGSITNTATVTAVACTYADGEPRSGTCTPVTGVTAQGEDTTTTLVKALANTGAGFIVPISTAGLALVISGLLLVAARGRRRSR